MAYCVAQKNDDNNNAETTTYVNSYTGVTATYVVNNPLLFVSYQYRIKATMNNEILCTSTPCYHIASLNCDDLSNCGARWQQCFIPRCKHSNNDNILAAGTTFVGSKLLVLDIVSPKSNDESARSRK